MELLNNTTFANAEKQFWDVVLRAIHYLFHTLNYQNVARV